jgi:hypothetical protein
MTLLRIRRAVKKGMEVFLNVAHWACAWVLFVRKHRDQRCGERAQVRCNKIEATLSKLGPTNKIAVGSRLSIDLLHIDRALEVDERLAWMTYDQVRSEADLSVVKSG